MTRIVELIAISTRMKKDENYVSDRKEPKNFSRTYSY